MLTAASVTTLVDPRTGRPRATAQIGGQLEVSAAVDTAREAAVAWARLTAGERSRRLLELAVAVEDDIERYVRAEQSGTGKPEAEARAEVANCVDVLRFYAGAVRAETTPGSGRRMPGHESWVRWEPLGVVAAIVPWNYPLLMAMWRLAPALAAGNAVVVKPAETTPDSVQLLAEQSALILGPDVISVLTGNRATGQNLVGSAVDAVAFTGSVRGGVDVAKRAELRRVSLELGGNCPALVLPDAPSDTYAELVAACTYNAGQSCAAPARVITLRENYEQTVHGLAAAMQQRPAGRDFGPLNNADQATRFDSIMARTGAGFRQEGDVALAEDEQDGFWRAGRILADVAPDDPAVMEEVFGPVLTVQSAPDLAGALRLANAMPQALAASVWCSEVGTALSLAGDVNAGEVWINCHLKQTAELPHGGRGGSGTGTDLSVLALADYQRPKTVTVRLGS
jgi:betaine-aldehyde dehydrogenase